MKQNEELLMNLLIESLRSECGVIKIPAIPKDHRESPQVGVDGFEPPTLCL